MAYQGISPYLYRNNLTNVQLLDDISSSFNGTTTQFNLTTNGSPFHAVSARSLLIILGGIVQEPDADYTVNAGVITFTTAPLSGLTFAARNIYGLNRLTGINDGLVTPASLSLGGPEWDTSGNLTVDGNITQTGETNNVYINTDTPTVRPTLDLNFERDQRLDSRITFSRNSTATYLGSDGLIKTALAGEPRFEFDTDGNCLGLLIEESRQNYLLSSGNIGGTSWNNSSSGATLTQNNSISPDGTTTATLLTNLNNQSDPDLFLRQSWNMSGGLTITHSLYVKAPDAANVGKNVLFRGKRLAGTISTWGEEFTLTAEWQRIYITHTYLSDNTQAAFYIGSQSTQTDPATSVLVWGAQVEVGSFATSYIPTSGSAVTRSVDEATITGTNFTDWYNSSEGTIFAKYSAGTYVSEVPFTISKTGDEINQIIAISSSSTGPISGVIPTIIVTDDGVTQTGVTIPIYPVDGDVIKTAIVYKENDFAIASGIGGDVGFASDSSGTIPTVDFARIGKYPYYGIWQNRPIARIMYYPERLSNAQLQNLTS